MQLKANYIYLKQIDISKPRYLGKHIKISIICKIWMFFERNIVRDENILSVLDANEKYLLALKKSKLKLTKNFKNLEKDYWKR